MSKNLKIYVVAHRDVDLSSLKLDDCYQLIRVGNYANQSNVDGIADNTGDNISHKNPNYCELTAHYWMWKNSNADLIGLCHYRRFFTSSIFSENVEGIPDKKEIMDVLSKYDIILPYRPIARRTVKNIYLDFGFEKDLNILRDLIKEKYPSCLNEYDSLMKRHSNYPANMLICNKKIFDEYSEWLFDILFEVEKRTDLTGYTQQQARIYGFMSERLLEVWVRWKKLRIKHYRILKTEFTHNVISKTKELMGITINPFKY